MITADEVASGGAVIICAGLSGMVAVAFLVRWVGRLFAAASGRAS